MINALLKCSVTTIYMHCSDCISCLNGSLCDNNAILLRVPLSTLILFYYKVDKPFR